jgi:late competence protein required for DNA uptake (superfamily II DNA/RNA helicase)
MHTWSELLTGILTGTGKSESVRERINSAASEGGNLDATSPRTEAERLARDVERQLELLG